MTEPTPQAAMDASRPTRAPAMSARPTRLSTALAALFAALFVPLLLLGSALLANEWHRQRELAMLQLSEEADSLRNDIEREAALDLSVLRTLAALPDFDRGDWNALHETATAAATTRPHSLIVVADADAHLLNTIVPLGKPLPRKQTLPSQPSGLEWKGRTLPPPSWRSVEQALRTSKPAFTGLFYGPIVKGPVVTSVLPVVRDGPPKYVVSLTYTPDAYDELLAPSAASREQLRTILDQNAVVVARSVGADNHVGRRAGPPFDGGVERMPVSGTGEGVNLDGVRSVYAYSRTELNGWTAVVAMPRDTLLAPARRALTIWLALLLAAGVIGATAAVRLWRRLARPLAALAEQAGSPETLVLTSDSLANIVEIDDVHRAMSKSVENLQIRRQAERERERAEARFRIVVESSPTGILTIDRSGLVTLVNQRIEALFGYSRDELLGQPVHRLVPQATQAAHADQVSTYFDAPTARAMGAGRDLHGRRKDGSAFPLEIGLVPIETEHGLQVLASVIDITERKHTEDELRRSNHDLEQFAYIASHDLQEPLRMVANYTQLIGERYRGQLDDKADKYIHYAVEGATRMHRLIVDLLAFSRVHARESRLVPVDAAVTLQAVLQTLQVAIEEASAHLDVGPLPTVLADEGQLAQVFQNLLGNALKFRGPKPARITVAAQRVEQLWQFSVHDEGIGFDPQFADRIFLMYQRLNARDLYAGSGIGLAIVRRIIERHGGRVWAESSPGKGASFHFTLQAVSVGDAPVNEPSRRRAPRP